MINNNTFLLAVLQELVVNTGKTNPTVESQKMEYVCERFRFSYLQSSNTTQAEVLNTLKNSAVELQSFLKIQIEDIDSELTRLASQEKQV